MAVKKPKGKRLWAWIWRWGKKPRWVVGEWR